jgi:hypothetical protein
MGDFYKSMRMDGVILTKYSSMWFDPDTRLFHWDSSPVKTRSGNIRKEPGRVDLI